MLKRVCSLPLGTRCLISVHRLQREICDFGVEKSIPYEAVILRSGSNGAPIAGWTHNPEPIGWEFPATSQLFHLANQFGCRYGWNLYHDVLVQTVEKPGQICFSCQKSSPHSPPNQTNGTFICSGCISEGMFQ